MKRRFTETASRRHRVPGLFCLALIGDGFGGEFKMMLYMADARALSAALGNAIDYADQSATVAAARLEDVS